ncbi:MAG: Mpo1-like protein, partial [Sphingomicrobium sp.]
YAAVPSNHVGWSVLAGVVLAIGIGGDDALAIAAHRLFEGNRPMIAVNPVWGAVADIRMTWLAATGRLRSELDRHRIDAAG